jgi:riboflavin transporter FmnP
MDTKAISLTIALAALALALNPAISGLGLPFPPLPGLIFNLWETVIIIAFFLTGFKGGLAVALLNTVFLLVVYPGPSRALYPLTNTVAVSAMMVGIYLANKIATRKLSEEKKPSPGKTPVYYTASAMVLRIIVMAPLMLALLYLTGVQDLAAAVLPVQAVYNIIQTLFTIPIGYFVASIVNKNFKFSSALIE